MSVPKKRKTSAKTKRGRSQKAFKPAKLIKCPKCDKPKKSHVVCPACGTYKGREVVKLKIKKKKESK